MPFHSEDSLWVRLGRGLRALVAPVKAGKAHNPAVVSAAGLQPAGPAASARPATMIKPTERQKVTLRAHRSDWP